jgi:hypothetical protein
LTPLDEVELAFVYEAAFNQKPEGAKKKRQKERISTPQNYAIAR